MIIITNITTKINTNFQNIYNNIFYDLDLFLLKCNKCFGSTFHRHGCYSRKVKVSGRLIDLKIYRVKCKYCNKTHAILPHNIVPYSRIMLSEQIRIINNDNLKNLMYSNFLIDEDNICYVKNQYNKHWKEKLRSFSISLCFDEVILNSIFIFNQQFMQIKCTFCLIFPHPT